MRNKLIPLLLVCLAASGQTPAFEAASIKPGAPLGPLGMRSDQKGGPGTRDPGLFSCLNCPLQGLVMQAYGPLLGFQFSAPGWLTDLRFDVTAKVPAGATKEQFRQMMQRLLAERFKLAVHREKKTMEVYELTVGKGGPKFKEIEPVDVSSTDGPFQPLKRDVDGFPVLPPGTTMAAIPGHARIHLAGEPMASLVFMLAGQLNSPVIDATGLTGKYDILVSWAYEERNSAPVAAEINPYLTELVNAVQSQLGLKLVRKKGDAEVLVVDHIERVPTEN